MLSLLRFVSGTGKRKSSLQKLTEECLAILEKKEYYEKCKSVFGGRNSFSKTDNDATFMHMKDDQKFLAQLETSLANIISPKGMVLRINRSIQAESAFGVMKEDMGFRRFLTRGQVNISTESLLLCFGFNINKLHSK